MNWRDLLAKVVDKYLLREYVRKNLEKYPVNLYDVYNSFYDIDFSKIPKSFIIKNIGDSGDVKDK